jgi:type IV secretory pathway VirB4 component
MNDFHAEHVAKMMDTFVNGALSLFNHRTNVDLNSRFISFDLSQTQENMRVTAMVVMMEMVRNKIRQNGREGKWTHVYIDEFHELLGIQCVARFVLKLWKEVRKMSGLMTGITQNMSDLMRSENDINLAQIFSNTESFFLLSQSTQDKELLMRFLPGISPAMFAYVDNSASGTGLLKMGTVTVPFDMVIKKNSEIYKLVNTDAGVVRGA